MKEEIIDLLMIAFLMVLAFQGIVIFSKIAIDHSLYVVTLWLLSPIIPLWLGSRRKVNFNKVSKFNNSLRIPTVTLACVMGIVLFMRTQEIIINPFVEHFHIKTASALNNYSYVDYILGLIWALAFWCVSCLLYYCYVLI